MPYGIPFTFLVKPDRPSYIDGKDTSITTKDITPPDVNVSFPEKPSVDPFSSSVPPQLIINKPVIGWFPVQILVPSLEEISLSPYQKVNFVLPDLTPSDEFKSDVKKPDENYDKLIFSFYEPEYIFVPVYYEKPVLKETEDFTISDFSFKVDVPKNELNWIDIDYEKYVKALEGRFFEKIEVEGRYLKNVGKSKLFYFEREMEHLRNVMREYIQGINSLMRLSDVIKVMKSFIVAERDRFLKYLSEKERNFLLFSFFSFILENSVRMREQKIRMQIEKYREFVRNISLRNQSDLILKQGKARLNEMLARSRLSYLRGKERLVEYYTVTNRMMRELFRIYSQGYILTTMIDVLNIERDRLIIERGAVLSRLEAIQNREDVMNYEREALLERSKVYMERVNELNERIQLLSNMLDTVKNEFEASWSSLQASLTRLDVRANIADIEARIAETRGIRDINRAYLEGFSRYVNTFIRLNRNFWQTYYDIRSYPLRFKENIQRSLLEIFEAKQYYDTYINGIYPAYFSLCEMDRQAAYAIAQARINAEIIESIS